MEDEHFEGREITVELVERFGIPMHLKDGATFLQRVKLELNPDELPTLTCEYVISKLEKQ